MVLGKGAHHHSAVSVPGGRWVVLSVTSFWCTMMMKIREFFVNK